LLFFQRNITVQSRKTDSSHSIPDRLVECVDFSEPVNISIPNIKLTQPIGTHQQMGRPWATSHQPDDATPNSFSVRMHRVQWSELSVPRCLWSRPRNR